MEEIERHIEEKMTYLGNFSFLIVLSPFAWGLVTPDWLNLLNFLDRKTTSDTLSTHAVYKAKLAPKPTSSLIVFAYSPITMDMQVVYYIFPTCL